MHCMHRHGSRARWVHTHCMSCVLRSGMHCTGMPAGYGGGALTAWPACTAAAAWACCALEGSWPQSQTRCGHPLSSALTHSMEACRWAEGMRRQPIELRRVAASKQRLPRKRALEQHRQARSATLQSTGAAAVKRGAPTPVFLALTCSGGLSGLSCQIAWELQLHPVGLACTSKTEPTAAGQLSQAAAGPAYLAG